MRPPPEEVGDAPVHYSGRAFSDAELQCIRRILAEASGASRYAISKRVCEALGWTKPNGELKDMRCRVVLLQMERDGLIRLPPPRKGHPNHKRFRSCSPETEPGPALECDVSDLPELALERVRGPRPSRLWNEYIDRYHYLGFRKLAGAQLRYLARARGQVVAALGFAAAAWKIAPRDEFIGWTHEQRKQNLHLIVNNVRFLILPWVRCTNLASKLLAMASRQLVDDWQQRYAYRPVLLETFVEVDRFQGTAYKAANWICVGNTQGRGKYDTRNRYREPIRGIWLYPLDDGFRHILAH